MESVKFLRLEKTVVAHKNNEAIQADALKATQKIRILENLEGNKIT
jgi:hypothetical protein